MVYILFTRLYNIHNHENEAMLTHCWENTSLVPHSPTVPDPVCLCCCPVLCAFAYQHILTQTKMIRKVVIIITLTITIGVGIVFLVFWFSSFSFGLTNVSQSKGVGIKTYWQRSKLLHFSCFKPIQALKISSIPCGLASALQRVVTINWNLHVKYKLRVIRFLPRCNLDNVILHKNTHLPC